MKKMNSLKEWLTENNLYDVWISEFKESSKVHPLAMIGNAIGKNLIPPPTLYLEHAGDSNTSLSGGFGWNLTKRGWKYWCEKNLEFLEWGIKNKKFKESEESSIAQVKRWEGAYQKHVAEQSLMNPQN